MIKHVIPKGYLFGHLDDQDMMTSVAGNPDIDYFEEEGNDMDEEEGLMTDIKERYFGDEEEY